MANFLANFPESVVTELPSEFSCGVYYGWARVGLGPVHKMVMSVGWNPHYQNKKKSMVRDEERERERARSNEQEVLSILFVGDTRSS